MTEEQISRRGGNKKAPAASGKLKKKSFIQKIGEYYMPEDISNIPEHIIYTMFIPAIFDAMCEALTNGVEMLFHGNAAGGSRRKGRKFDDPLGYNKVSSGKSGTKMRVGDGDERVHGVDIFIPGGIRDLEDFLDTLDEDIDEFDWISVSDVYQRADIKINYAKQDAFNRYGWTTLNDVTYKKTWDWIDGKKVQGYIVHFPKPAIQA